MLRLAILSARGRLGTFTGALVALFASAWYAFHTANAETVNYIIQRAEILSTLAVVLTLLVFARGGRGRRWGLYLIPAAAAVLHIGRGLRQCQRR